MNAGELHPSSLPRYLIPNVMLPQANLSFQNDAMLKSIPLHDESVLVRKSFNISNPEVKQQLEDNNSIRDSKASVAIVSTKGRRPKKLSEATVSGFELGMGLLTDRPRCGSCGKYFMSRQQLNQHMLVHTDVRKYKCIYCDRSFKQPSHLHQHHRIHTGEKPYKCIVAGCFRAFPQQSNLNHHLRNHDKPAPPPENTCSLCMRTYASETVLRSHISKIHMCEPDMLLGAKRKLCTKDISRIQDGENVTQVDSNSRQVLNHFSKNKEPSVEPCVKREAFEKHIDLTKPLGVEPIAVDERIKVAQQLGYMIQDNTDYRIKDRNTQTQEVNHVGHEQIIANNDTEISNVTDNSCNTSIMAGRMSMHNVRATTSNIATPLLNVAAFQVEQIPSALDQSLFYPSGNGHHLVVDAVLDETMSSEMGKSRKRKAFQPKRIVHRVKTTDEIL